MEHGEEKPDPEAAPNTAESAALIGADVGPYRIVEKLGEGGMGVVFKATDRGLDREVALKILFEVDEEANVKRFQQEARALAKLAHPNAIRIFWIGEYKGYPCFAMEYIPDGVSVYDLLHDKGVLPLDASIDIIIQAAKGLSAARRAGIVHRDIKPNNLLIDADGTVKISDFGLAKIVDGEGHLTQSGIVMGTPYYMSPEQGQGDAIDHRSDLYSLGATFYHMITGFTPYEAQNPVSLIIKHVKEPIPDIRRVNPAIPDPIRRIVERCLEKDPDERYQEYEELIEDLESFQNGQAPANAPEVKRRKIGGSMPAWVYFVAGLGIAGGGALAMEIAHHASGGGTVGVGPTPGASVVATLAMIATPTRAPVTATPLPAVSAAPGEADAAAEELLSQDPVARAHGATTLGRLAVAAALPGLAEHALHDADAAVRARATWALGRMPPSDAGTIAIIDALKDRDPGVVTTAIAALDGSNDIRVVEPLRALADHSTDDAIRRAAASVVEKIADVDASTVFGTQPASWWRSRFRENAATIAASTHAHAEADRAVRYYRQRYGFTAGDKNEPAEPDRKRIYDTVYIAAERELASSDAAMKQAQSRQQSLVVAADSAKVPDEFRR